MTKIIAPGTLKGGTGKSMLVFQICGALPKSKKILVIDADAQSNLTSNFGIDFTDWSRPSTRTIFEDPSVDPSKLILKGQVAALPNVDIIPSSIMLYETEADLPDLFEKGQRETVLKGWFEENEGAFSDYDYIFIDTSPSMGLVNQNVFACADSIVLVVNIDFNALSGAQAFTYLWHRVRTRKALRDDDNVKALVINGYDSRESMSPQLVEYIEGNEELKPLYAAPPIYTRAAIKKSIGNANPYSATLASKVDPGANYRLLIKNLKKKDVL